MKKIILFLLLCLSLNATAQEECDYTIIKGGDGKEFRSTKDYLMYEKVFGGTSQYIFFSLANKEGVPVLNFQMLSKSDGFTKAYCFDKTSKIHLQLLNGKVVTLINIMGDQCPSLAYDGAENQNIKILTSSFVFTKGSLDDLEKHPISFMKVTYTGDTVDYPVRKELASQAGVRYNPERYFINNLKCIQ